MSDLNLSMTADADLDDLPLTLLRERDARAREARVHEALKEQGRAAEGETPRFLRRLRRSKACADDPVPAAVTRFDVPFVRLVTFFLKAVIAAVPAFLLLAALLWLASQLLESHFPDLVKLKILISFPIE